MQTEQMKITCKGCGAETTLDVQPGHPEMVDSEASGRGWSFRGDEVYCPECTASQQRFDSESGPADTPDI